MDDKSTSAMDVAIVGMAGRFPGARDVDELWELLASGREGISHAVESAAHSSAPASQGGVRQVRASGKLADIEHFDAAFFGFTARQAVELDPQQRIFLECAWESLEDAGCDPTRFSGAIGVFAGAGANRYAVDWLVHDLRQGKALEVVQRTLSCDKDFLATRVSYKLNLRGPSFTLQTACSTGLVAVHLACQSLLAGESDIAVAGGISIQIPHDIGYTYNEGGILSPDGHCRAFDAEAQGTVPASGVGIVVLRRLDEAIEARHHIYGVIKGSAINNDGSAKVGYTAPSVDGQRAVLEMALGEIPPDEIDMIEAHGTGTTLGDAVELTALSEVFGRGSSRVRPCALGSIKSNIGHLDAAAGVAGLIKAALCLHKQRLVPSLHFRKAHPLLDTSSSPFRVNTELRPWSRAGRPRRAGVSSFGMGGTNAHVVLEEAPEPSREITAQPRPCVFPLSARSAAALTQVRRKLGEFVRRDAALSLADVAYTLQVGRAHFQHRDVIVASRHEELVALLASPERPGVLMIARAPEVALLVEDGAEADLAVAARLYRTDAAWCSEFDSQAHMAAPHIGFDLRKALLEHEGGVEARSARSALHSAALALAVQRCTALTLSRWCPQPPLLLAEGLGELTAACLTDMISFVDAMRILVAIHSGNGFDGATIAAIRVQHASRRWISRHTGTQPPIAQLSEPRAWRQRILEKHPYAGSAEQLAGAGALIVPCRCAALRDWCVSRLPDAGDSAATGLLARAAGALWLAGVVLDWRAIHGSNRPFLTRLPTYPFERERFWLEEAPERFAVPSGAVTAAPSPSGPSASEVKPLQFHLPSWKASPRPLACDIDSLATAGAATWLVITDGSAIAEAMLQRLRSAGAQVAAVRLGADYAASGGHNFVISPDEPAHFDRLIDTLRREGAAISRIVHFVPCPTAADTGLAAETFHQMQRHGALCLLRLVQAVLRAGSSGELAVAAVTRRLTPDLQSVLDAAAEMLVPLVFVISQERPKLAPLVIEVPHLEAREPGAKHSGALRAQRYAEWIVSELSAPSQERVIAYRGERRLTRSFDSIAPAGSAQLPETPPAAQAVANGSARLREGGVYLITGGLGTLGLALAETLAACCKPRLLLLSRAGLPERADWQGILARSAATDSIAARIRRVQGIEALGARVSAPAVDVADESTLAHAVSAAEREWGKVDGVFHLAGALADASVQVPLDRLSEQHFERQMRPKIGGALALESVFAHRTLDLAVLFSSTAAVLGGTGFGAYAAANAALDALARGDRRCGGTPWLALSWDGWASGDAARHDASTIGVEEGMSALLRALNLQSLTPQLILSRDSIEERLQAQERVRSTAVAAVPEAESPKRSRPRVSSEFVAPRSDVERLVAQMWEESLGVSGLGVHDDFFELGGDSLIMMNISSRVADELHVEVPLQVSLRSGMSVAAFAELVVTRS